MAPIAISARHGGQQRGTAGRCRPLCADQQRDHHQIGNIAQLVGQCARQPVIRLCRIRHAREEQYRGNTCEQAALCRRYGGLQEFTCKQQEGQECQQVCRCAYQGINGAQIAEGGESHQRRIGRIAPAPIHIEIGLGAPKTEPYITVGIAEVVRGRDCEISDGNQKGKKTEDNCKGESMQGFSRLPDQEIVAQGI